MYNFIFICLQIYLNTYYFSYYYTCYILIFKIFFQFLDELQESGFIPSHSFGVKPIEAKLSFLIFLWHLANTEPLRTISDRFNVSISSVFRVIRRVTAWILTKLDDIY